MKPDDSHSPWIKFTGPAKTYTLLWDEPHFPYHGHANLGSCEAADLTGPFGARRGPYRPLYRIDDERSACRSFTSTTARASTAAMSQNHLRRASCAPDLSIARQPGHPVRWDYLKTI